MVSDDSAIDTPFALIAGERLRAGEAQRARMLKRAGAGLAVLLVHVLILFALLTGIVAVPRIGAPPKEIVFILPPLSQNKPERTPTVPQAVPQAHPATEPLRTITLPPPQPRTEPQRAPTDVMQAIGKELACGAGPYEHLSQAEREACRRQPWKFKKTAKGVIVLDAIKQAPPPDDSVSGADADLHIQQTQDPCLAAGNTHSECIHKTIFGR